MVELAPVDQALDPGHRHRGGSSYSYRANILSLDPDDDTARDAHAAHEMSHFFMHASTPYGHFLDRLTSLSTSLAIEFFEEFAVRFDTPAPFPGFAFARRVLAGDVPHGWRGLGAADLRDVVSRRVVPWSETIFLENVLEGIDTPSVRSAAQPRAARALAVVERADMATTDDDLFASLDTATLVGTIPERSAHMGEPMVVAVEGPACISVIRQGVGLPTGGSHLFEALALLAEQVGDLEPFVDERFGYIAPWILFYGKHREQHSEPDERRYFALRETFGAICELALFTPLGAVYGRLRAPDASWAAVHPALRFLSALEVVNVLDLWTSGSDPLALQQRISDALEWPAPEAFVALGAEVSSGGPDGWRHADACRLRQENHATFLDPEAHEEPLGRFLGEHLPLYRSAKDDSLVVRHHEIDVTTALELLLDHFATELSWHLMVSDRVIGLEMLPRQMDLSQVFRSHGNPRTPEELLAIFYEAMPFLAPARLRHIDAS